MELLNGRFLLIPHVSITTRCLTTYSRCYDLITKDYIKRHYEDENGEIIKPPRDHQHNGRLSSKAYSRIRRSVDLFLLSVDENILIDGTGKEKVTFVTLTLPASQVKELDYKYDWVEWHHTDQEIKAKCLNQFLIEMTKKHGVNLYLWRAEKQLNGNIHFHLLFDKRIHWQIVRDSWNRIINKLGYVDRYKKEMEKLSYPDYFALRTKGKQVSKTNEDKICKAYEKGCSEKWQNPNSTDIHSLRGIKDVAGYISKYMSKSEIDVELEKMDEDKEMSGILRERLLQVQGRIWYCSKSISQARRCVVEAAESGCMHEFASMFDSVEEKLRFKEEYFATVIVKYRDLKEKCKSIYTHYHNHLSGFFDNFNYIEYASTG